MTVRLRLPLRHIFLIHFAALLSLLVLPPLRALAGPTKQEYDDLQERLRRERSRIQTLVTREGSVLDEIEKADRRIAEEKKALEKIGVRLTEIEAERDGLAVEIDHLEGEVGKTKELLEKRLRRVYRQFREGSLAALVSTEDYQGLIQRAKYLTYFADRDRRLIQDYRDGQTLLQNRRRELRGLEDELEKTAERRRAQKAKYNTEKDNKKILLASIRSEKSYYTKMVGEMEEASVRLKELLRQEEERKRREAEEAARSGQPGRPFAKMKGGLRWPVNGQVISRFGSQRDPEFNTPVFRNGIEIAANEGAKIEAVLDGRIVYADRFRGYGNLVIVDHGDGYHTLYAHLSESAVIPGETVGRGQVMGIVGDSGSGRANSLYFEIRHRGKPIDPVPWLARRRRR